MKTPQKPSLTYVALDSSLTRGVEGLTSRRTANEPSSWSPSRERQQISLTFRGDVGHQGDCWALIGGWKWLNPGAPHLVFHFVAAPGLNSVHKSSPLHRLTPAKGALWQSLRADLGSLWKFGFAICGMIIWWYNKIYIYIYIYIHIYI